MIRRTIIVNLLPNEAEPHFFRRPWFLPYPYLETLKPQLSSFFFSLLFFFSSDVTPYATLLQVLYLHTQGVSYKEIPIAILDWTRLGLYFTVETMDRAVALLDTGRFDAVGAWGDTSSSSSSSPSNSSSSTVSRYFPGNFWWARAEYIAALPPLMRRYDTVQADEGVGPPAGPEPTRDAAKWVGLGRDTVTEDRQRQNEKEERKRKRQRKRDKATHTESGPGLASTSTPTPDSAVPRLRALHRLPEGVAFFSAPYSRDRYTQRPGLSVVRAAKMKEKKQTTKKKKKKSGPKTEGPEHTDKEEQREQKEKVEGAVGLSREEL